MLCEGYWDAQGLHHSGFYCPRLSDPPEQSYCCQWGEHSLKDCCNQSQFQRTMNVSQSGRSTSKMVHSRPLSLVAVLLYGALVVFLMVVDFLWFCRERGLTVTAALRNYFTCLNWATSLSAPNGNQPQRCHGNRNPSPPHRHRNPQSLPCLQGNRICQASDTGFSSNQNTELSHLDPEVSSKRTEDDVRWPEE
nr:PREDICTED: uncharacterized protein KIAA1644-like [Lepisosteus oculatus]